MDDYRVLLFGHKDLEPLRVTEHAALYGAIHYPQHIYFIWEDPDG